MGLGYFVPDRSFCRSNADTAGRSSIDQNIFTIMKARTRVLSQLTAIVTCFFSKYLFPCFFTCRRTAVIDSEEKKF